MRDASDARDARRTRAVEYGNLWPIALAPAIPALGIAVRRSSDSRIKIGAPVGAALAWERAPNAKRMGIRLLREAAWVVAMWMLASSAELLWAFTAYFCLGHAADSWRAEFLHHQNVTKTFWTYYTLAVPFTLTALAGLLLIGWAAYTGWIDVRWAWAVLLAGSVPHMILLDHWAPAQLRAVKA